MSNDLPYEELFKSANSAARHYWSLGLDPIPFTSYQENSLVSRETPFKWTPEEIDRNFGADDNVGLALGDRSGNLIDVDLDWEEASHVSMETMEDLPPFGRTSARYSHRLAKGKLPKGVICFKIPDNAAHLFDAERLTVLELRGNGHQAMVPPSLHPTGEHLEWELGFDGVPEVDGEQLIQDAGLTAFLAVVARVYPRAPSNRDNICLTLAGALLRAGHHPGDVDVYVEKVAWVGCDEEYDERGDTANAALFRLWSGQDIGDISSLCKQLGIEPMADTLREWLGISDGDNDGGGGNAVTVYNSNCSPRTLDGSATPVRFSEDGCDE